MALSVIKKNVYFIPSIHWDRRLFDDLIPLPEGTSYNAYLVKGEEKTALIDSTDFSKIKDLINNFKHEGIKKIDYVVSNHSEQDHSGAIPAVLEEYPMAKVVVNKKSKEFLKDLLLIEDEKFIVVEDYETIDLGGKTLEFILTPWVHWPETMVTYLKEDNILFSCDFFGSHFTTSDLYVTEKEKDKVYHAAKRYFAEIMMPFRNQIIKNIEKLKNYKIDFICPSHGPMYDDPNFIINAYKDWISDNTVKEVLIPYVSMHGSTEKAVEFLTDELIKRNIKVKPFNLTETDLGDLAINLVDASTIIVATPTVMLGPHPTVVSTAYLLNALKPKTKHVGLIVSYSWGTKAVEMLAEGIPNLKVDLFEPIKIKGYPKESDFKQLKKLAEDIENKLKEK